WTDKHTQLFKEIKIYAKEIPCLHLASPLAFKIVESDASDIDYGGILKQLINNNEQLIQYNSGTWNNAQKNYATIKKEILAIVLCVQKLQSDLLNKKFLIRVHCAAANSIFNKRCKKSSSKTNILPLARGFQKHQALILQLNILKEILIHFLTT
ncbi:hypothetical protein CFOL_v3_35544, partial [Cephalotus follicularis]